VERRRRKIKERGWKMRTKREEGVGEKREEIGAGYRKKNIY